MPNPTDRTPLAREVQLVNRPTDPVQGLRHRRPSALDDPDRTGAGIDFPAVIAIPETWPVPHPAQPPAARPLTLHLGVVLEPRAAELVRSALETTLSERLAARFPGTRWTVSVVHEVLTRPPAGPTELLEETRDRMLDADWDLAVVLTDSPLRDGHRTLAVVTSPVHGVGLVSVPALGPVRVQRRAEETVVGVVTTLLGAEAEGRSPDRRLRQLAADTKDHPGDNAVEFAARVLGGNLWVLLGMVRANRPWRLALRLSRSLTVAAASGVAALVTSDLWSLSASYGSLRLTGLGVLSVGALTLALVLGGGLWERARHRREREQVVLFNLATLATVVIGVLVYYLALFVLAWLGALLLVPGSVYATSVGTALGAAEYGRLAWLTATIATVGGALGAGLEDYDDVRDAAYTHTSEAVQPLGRETNETDQHRPDHGG